MPVYFFNVRDGETLHVDHAGQDLPDNMSAWQEATARAEAWIHDLDGKPANSSCRIEVIGEGGRLLCAIEAKANGTA
jgi:hypothetical protein